MEESFVNGRKQKTKRKNRIKEQKELENKARKLRARRKLQKERTNEENKLQDEKDNQRVELDGSSNPLDDFNSNQDWSEQLEEDTQQEQTQQVEEINIEEKETFRQKTRKRIRKVRKRLLATKLTVGMFSLLSLLAVPIMIGLFALFFIAVPVMAVVLPAGAFSILTADESGDVEVRNKGVSVTEGTTVVGELSEEDVKKGAVFPLPHTRNITSKFGVRVHPISKEVRMHNGNDYASGGVDGKPIVAYQDGKVVTSKFNAGGYGHYVTIQHGDNVQTLYAHMKEAGVAIGTTVRAGDKIGRVGNTGGSTGSHLHFEVKIKQPNGTFKAVDPTGYLTGL